ncbi:neuropeptide y [Plakobranchus ocellatus]|uniref:Neuropeptide y n=1 Tax=Plakobranchus ocellatus TaxID=259542 RepID=A0AAV4CJV6_9GAST|nr:neuropeptide y [Plakobranchus ocellatus]
MANSEYVLVMVPEPASQEDTPEPNDTSDGFPQGELFTWHGTALIFIPLMMLLGISGNLLVYYIYHFRWRKNVVTLFKKMLAILDLCNMLLALPPLLYLTINPYDDSFLTLCDFTSFIALGTAIASGGVLVIIAVDRYMKLRLLRKTGVGSMLSKQLFAVSIITACIINIPTMWIFGRDTIQLRFYNVSVSYCFIRKESYSSGMFLGWVAVLTIVFFSITVALVYLYWCVVRKLQDLSDKHDELKRQPSVGVVKESLVKQKQSEIMRQSCIVFIAVTVVFFATYMPYFITLIISMFSPDILEGMSPYHKAYYDLAKLCPLLSAISNPFIYSFTSKQFRKEVSRLFTCQNRSRNTIDKAYQLPQVSE